MRELCIKVGNNGVSWYIVVEHLRIAWSLVDFIRYLGELQSQPALGRPVMTRVMSRHVMTNEIKYLQHLRDPL